MQNNLVVVLAVASHSTKVVLKQKIEKSFSTGGPKRINSLVGFGVVCFDIPVRNIVVIFVSDGLMPKISTVVSILSQLINCLRIRGKNFIVA